MTPARRLTIAIDGPAGSGKSSVARLIAQKLGYTYLDSGAMYRALALKALEGGGFALSSERELEDLARSTQIELRPVPATLQDPSIHNQVFLDGEDVTQSIRTNEVAQAASRVATVPGVRRILVAQQQRAGADGGVVMEGRDIGSVVFPNAELKIFLDAAPQARAERRSKEHIEKGEHVDAGKALEEIRERDKRDSERKESPLVRAADAVLVDNTAMDVKETARLIVQLARERQLQLNKDSGVAV
ncbi:MAG TPA: (d)CMP kinase [Candidatus Acidoferrum sp.]|jgi:cytidylate kinase